MLPDLYYLVMRAWLSVDGGSGHDHTGGEGGRWGAVPPPRVIPPGLDGTLTFVVAIGGNVVVVLEVGGRQRRDGSGQVLRPRPRRARAFFFVSS